MRKFSLALGVIMSIIAMIAIPNSNDHITKAYSCISSSSVHSKHHKSSRSVQ
ncbi:MAG TPA: hypothetical protein VEL70_05105 [Candidatus Acidoferrum sp.]|nr:hypothetical protein [Candidatus Acidoferrum sp.]